MNTKLTKEQSVQIKGKEISFIQKCIIIAHIFNNKKKTVVNPFNNIPYVKLYTANLTVEKFVYSKIKGALFVIYEENNGKTEFFLQIYDINDYSLVFSLPVNDKLLEGIIIEENFIIIPTKHYFIGFKFASIYDMKQFILMLRCEKQESEINIKAKEFLCDDTKKTNIISNIKKDFGKKIKNIDNINDIINSEKNSFQKLDELYKITNCIEYSEINNKINIFIDKTINTYRIKSYIDAYRNSKNRNALPYKIIFNDYSQIKNKKAYVEILVRNIIRNFEEEKRLIVFKREHKQRHEKEGYSKNNDIRYSSVLIRPNIKLDDNNKLKASIKSTMMPIKEEKEENYNKQNKNKK
jgi:hypothetical protein